VCSFGNVFVVVVDWTSSLKLWFAEADIGRATMPASSQSTAVTARPAPVKLELPRAPSRPHLTPSDRQHCRCLHCCMNRRTPTDQQLIHLRLVLYLSLTPSLLSPLSVSPRLSLSMHGGTIRHRRNIHGDQRGPVPPNFLNAGSAGITNKLFNATSKFT